MRQMILALVLVALAGCGGEEPQQVAFDVQGSFSQAQGEALTQALAEFEAVCPALIENWAAVEAATVSVSRYDSGRPDLGPYRQRAYGWDAELEIRIKLKDEPRNMPPPLDARAAGHSLWYFLGAGDTPGVVATKSYSLELCNITPPKPGSDGFQRVAGLSVLDRL